MGSLLAFIAKAWIVVVVAISGPADGSVARVPANADEGRPAHADATHSAPGAGWRDWLNRIFSSGANSEPDAALKRLGGSRLLLQLDADALRREALEQLQQDVRKLLREERIPYQGLAMQDGSVDVRIVRESDRERAGGKLAQLAAPTGSGEGGVDVRDAGEGLLRLTPTQAAFASHLREQRQRSIDIIGKRLEAFGVVAAAARPHGPDRILVLVPGIRDPEQVRAMLYKTASLTFRLIDTSMTPEQALERGAPVGSEILYERKSRLPHLVIKHDPMRGGAIVQAMPGFDQRTNEPIVTFRFDAAGTRRFAQVTQENVGRPFAVVLDGEVVSAPIIREPILGGSGQVSGNFTLAEANTLAILLSSGTPPASVMIIDQQVVEPEPKAGQR
jgi:preprotein translocase subunit SecD